MKAMSIDLLSEMIYFLPIIDNWSFSLYWIYHARLNNSKVGFSKNKNPYHLVSW